MEILSPASSPFFSGSAWLAGEKWTAAENKVFENALALFDENTPDRWHKVAAMVPGKTVGDVIRQYKELESDVTSIEAGLIPLPGYTTTAQIQPHGRKTARSSDHERKKGIPWTEEEHKLFLMGLKKYGKGDWRNISRNFVVSRTPTQVASHAQKYFIRQLNGGKDKRRASIHDITTVNLDDESSHHAPPPENRKFSPEKEQSQFQKVPFIWNNEFMMGFGEESIGFFSNSEQPNSYSQDSIFAVPNLCFHYTNP